MAQFKGKWIGDQQINETKVLLQNDQYLKGRDFANAADLNIIKVNASDAAEFGIEPQWATAPTLPESLTNKEYVDQVVFGMRDPKDACRACAGANISISSAPASIDGVTLVSGDRVLLPYQTIGSENGIYNFNGVGVAMSRSTDADDDAEVTQGLSTLITEGTQFAKTNWALTTADPIVVGTTALVFARVPNLGSVLGFRSLSATILTADITNGYIDLAHPILDETLTVAPVGGPIQEVGVDYSLSNPVLNSRLTFAGDLSTYLAANDKLLIKYIYEI